MSISPPGDTGKTDASRDVERWIRAYYEAGWCSVIPLPPRTKHITDAGLTGAEGRDLDVEESVRMATSRGWTSMALRMPDDVVILDVDGYRKKGVQKRGLESLQWLEDGPPGGEDEALGALPMTWIVTSRIGDSGGRLFRVPAGRRWASTAGPDIEVIQRGHRYQVVPPSEHEDGGRYYGWHWGRTGDVRDRSLMVPRVDELPELPESWIKHLSVGSGTARRTSGLRRPELLAELTAMPSGPPCPEVEEWALSAIRAASRQLGAAHDALLHRVARLVLMGMGGCPGVQEALFEARSTYVALPDGGEAHAADFDVMLLGAIDHLLGSGGSTWQCSLVGAEIAASVDLSYLDVSTPDPEPVAEAAPAPAAADPPAPPGESVHVNDAAWWGRRMALAQIRTFARARMVSPAAVLAVVLCRALAQVPPTMALPAIIGSRASLNFWVALVGESGDGKTTAEAVAAECIDMGTVHTLTPGTGEGIAASYVRRGDPKKGEPEVVQHTWSVFFTVGEVETLISLGARTGTTLWSELRKTWSGEALGFANRDPKTRLPVVAHGYRLTMSVGMQPTKAEPILDDADAGMPQRFVWFPTGDPNAPDDLPEEPTPLRWSAPWGWEVAGATEFEVADEIQAEIRQTRRDRRKRIGDPMAGHRALTKLKLAAALAVLDERVVVHVDDWALAEDIMASSDQVRTEVETTIKGERAKRSRATATARGLDDVTRDEVKHDAAVKRVCQLLKRKVGTDWTTWGELSRQVANRDRPHLRDAVDRLLGTGDIEVDEAADGRGEKYRKVAK